MQKYLTNKIHIHRVLRAVKLIYRITPARIRTDISSDIADIRNFALYLLVKYSSASFEMIADKFVDITIKKLKSIKADISLSKKYEKDELKFLDIFKEGYDMSKKAQEELKKRLK